MNSFGVLLLIPLSRLLSLLIVSMDSNAHVLIYSAVYQHITPPSILKFNTFEWKWLRGVLCYRLERLTLKPDSLFCRRVCYVDFMFQIGEPDFINQTRFWRLIIQHHRINSTNVASPHLNVAERSNPSALKPEECMGDVWWYASWIMGINSLFPPKICQRLCIWYSGCKFWLPLQKYFLLVYSEVAEVTRSAS